MPFSQPLSHLGVRIAMVFSLPSTTQMQEAVLQVLQGLPEAAPSTTLCFAFLEPGRPLRVLNLVSGSGWGGGVGCWLVGWVGATTGGMVLCGGGPALQAAYRCHFLTMPATH